MLRTITLVVLSVALLVISYPQIDAWPLAWAALVPFLFALDGKKVRSAFGLGYLCGFLFFAGTLGWFIYVTYPGAFLLVAYFAVYFAVFAVAFVYFQRLPLLARIFTLAAFWVALEYIRSHALSGFNWVSLGHSQYKNYLLIQVADLTGVYGVSFLVMLINLLVFESVRFVKRGQYILSPFYQIRRAQMVVIVLLLSVLGYGAVVVSHPRPFTSVDVGVVQPNVPQSLKWDPRLKGKIVARTVLMTREFAAQKPEIIIWPETSLPGILDESPALFNEIKKAAADLQVPILVGIVDEKEGKYYNSAVLVSAQGKIDGQYNKMHLVPFGEYLPFRPVLGFVSRIVPLEDFTAGTEYKLFPAGCEEKKFGVLICFEDTLAYLRRGSVNAGASFLVNMTNDAWFEDTKAPFLHLQAAVFGAVENKRSLVRAANTGFSGFIDPFGRVISAVHNSAGKQTFVPGIARARVPVLRTRTFYTKYGDVFTGLCFLGIPASMAYCRRQRSG